MGDEIGHECGFALLRLLKPPEHFLAIALSVEGGVQQTSITEVQNGKPLLIDFFAPWCDSCPAAAKQMSKLSEEFGGQCKFLLLCVDGS